MLEVSAARGLSAAFAARVLQSPASFEANREPKPAASGRTRHSRVSSSRDPPPCPAIRIACVRSSRCPRRWGDRSRRTGERQRETSPEFSRGVASWRPESTAGGASARSSSSCLSSLGSPAGTEPRFGARPRRPRNPRARTGRRCASRRKADVSFRSGLPSLSDLKSGVLRLGSVRKGPNRFLFLSPKAPKVRKK